MTTSEDFPATHSGRISARGGLFGSAEAGDFAAANEVEQHRNPGLQFVLRDAKIPPLPNVRVFVPPPSHGNLPFAFALWLILSDLRFFAAGRAVLSPVHGPVAQSQGKTSQHSPAVGGESGRDQSGQRLRSVDGVQHRPRAHFSLRFFLCREWGWRARLGNHLQRGHKAKQKAAANQIGGGVPVRHSRLVVLFLAGLKGHFAQSLPEEPGGLPLLSLLSGRLRSRSRELRFHKGVPSDHDRRG